MYMQAAGMGANAAGAEQNAKAQKTSLLYDSQVASNNARIADWQAEDALYQGGVQQQAIQLQATALKSSQRASMAANGIDTTEGSANDVLTSTDYLSTVDVNTARDNALKAAWGYRTQAAGFRDAAVNARASSNAISPGKAALLSLLGGAGQVATSWYAMSKTGAGGSGSGGGNATGS
jgi:hypothetical protein